MLNLIFEDNFIIIYILFLKYQDHMCVYIYILNWILFVKIIKKIIFIENKLSYKNKNLTKIFYYYLTLVTFIRGYTILN